MDRLFRRRQPGPPPQPELEPIRIYARDIEVTGWVTPAGERITDLLVHGKELPFLPQGADPSDPDNWFNLVPDGVLVVVPPPHVSPPEKQLHRQQERVMIRIGPYVLTGTAHLKPGFEQDLFLRATQPFLPLTDATLVSEASPDEVHYDVVIVNLNEVEELKEL